MRKIESKRSITIGNLEVPFVEGKIDLIDSDISLDDYLLKMMEI